MTLPLQSTKQQMHTIRNLDISRHARLVMCPYIRWVMCPYRYIRWHSHAQTRKQSHTHGHKYMYCMHKHICMPIHIHVHIQCSHARKYALAHAHKHSHPHTCIKYTHCIRTHLTCTFVFPHVHGEKCNICVLFYE